MATNIQSDEKQRPANQDHSTQQSYHLELKDRQRLPRQEKAKGVHYHQTSIIWNVKGYSLRRWSKKDEKHDQKKGNKHNSINNWI